jgi:hypothetical protein
MSWSVRPSFPAPMTRSTAESYRGLETRLQGRASPCTRTPRFLPASCRHGSAPFRALVQVEGDPPRPRRRERPAGGPPTGLRTEASQVSRWLAKDPQPHARERAEAGPSRERKATRRDRTRAPQKRRARGRREIAGVSRREWRGSPGAARRSRRGEAEPGAGIEGHAARPSS